ncbi:MAG: histidine kinase [Bacteroidales bacterium]
MSSRTSSQEGGQSSQLDLFKRLLQPHFLFNSLNNLYALSLHRSDQTPQAIAGLSHLLERVVEYARRDLILLSEEVELIQEYVALERIWLGETSFRLDIQVKGESAGVVVPPLAIYTLVENAFKHGVRQSGSRGWITIHIVVKNDKVLVKIRNSYYQEQTHDISPSVTHTGLGIEAVRKILEGSFRKHYYLDARPIGNMFAVDLIFGHVAA